MGYFADIQYMYGGGYYGIFYPSFEGNTISGTTYQAAFTQEPCVFRILANTNTNTSYVVATIYTQYGLSGQNAVQVNVSVETFKTQYLDITDVLRSGLLRKSPTSSFADTQTPCRLELEEFDSTDTTLGTRSFDLYAYDATEPLAMAWQAPMPDTFRMLDSAGIPSNMFPISLRLLPGYYDLSQMDSGGNKVVSLSGTSGNSQTFQAYMNTAATEVMMSGSGSPMSARVLWEPCASDHMQVRWWSPVFGGWKSCCVKLRGGGYTVGDKADYVTMFNPYGAHTGTESLSCVIENCTPNDVHYYSDLYISDQVEVYWDSFVQYTKRVKVTGTPPAYGKGGYVDMEFDMQVEEVTTLC